MHIALKALRSLNLHAVWWLVSPQNPLKKRSDNFAARLSLRRRFVRHPKKTDSDIETRMKSDFSLQSVRQLRRRFPNTHFFWIAGMDNAGIFHRWNGWRTLIRLIPFIFFNRP